MYMEDGLTRELAAARVCQDVVLKAISIGPLNRNVTIKGGVVMRSITNNNRRATRDIDLDVEQEEYCFDVCMDENGASLLKNTVEQSFTEKLRSLLIFGSNSRRYKDIYDMYYQKTVAKRDKLLNLIDHYIFSDPGMRENTMGEIITRLSNTFRDKQYLKRVDSSRQRWVDDDINEIADAILKYLSDLNISNNR